MSAVEHDWAERKDRLSDWYVKPDVLEWKALLNPAHPGHVHVEWRDDQVAGTAAVWPRRLLIGGKAVLGAEIGDTFTHPDYRRQGIFSQCVRACTDFCLEHGIEIIYGGPNAQSLPGYRDKLGFPVADHAQVNYLVKYVDPDALGDRVAGATHLPHCAARLGAPMARRLLFGASPAGRRVADLEVRSLDRFPDVGDGQWGTSRSGLAFFGVRDSDYLNWRFFANPHDYLVLGGFRGSALAGYAAARIIDDDGVTKALLADCIATDDSPEVARDLISALEAHLKARGVATISAYSSAGSPYFDALRRLGFRPRRRGIDVILFQESAQGHDLAAMDAPWHFMLGDLDHC